MGQVEIVERRMIEKLMRSWVGKKVTVVSPFMSTVSMQIEGELVSTTYGWYSILGYGSNGRTYISFGEKHVEDAWDGSYGEEQNNTFHENRVIRIKFLELES